jgi:hypothetical protein
LAEAGEAQSKASTASGIENRDVMTPA